jgi:lysozyme family protein
VGGVARRYVVVAVMAEPKFSDLKKLNRQRWDNAKILAQWSAEADRQARKIMGLAPRYKVVEKLTGVPWYVIAVKHLREASCDFRGVLHNGEKIIGKNRKTTLVPANRGPFKTWEEAAVDALRLKDLHRITDWSIERVLYECERFNGWGYHWKKRVSPYVWSGTNLYSSGKYVSDGKYSASHVDTQLGVAIVLKKLQAMGVQVDPAKPVKPAPIPPPPDIEPIPDAPEPAKPGWLGTVWRKIGAAVGTATGLGGITWLTDWQIAAMFFAFLLILIGGALAVFFWIWDAEDVREWFKRNVG